MLQLPFSKRHAGSHLIVSFLTCAYPITLGSVQRSQLLLGAELGFVPPGARRWLTAQGDVSISWSKAPSTAGCMVGKAAGARAFTEARAWSTLHLPCSLKHAWRGLGTAGCAPCCLSPLLLAGPWRSWRRSWNPSESGGKSWRASWMPAAPRSAALGRAGREPTALLLCLWLVGRTAVLLFGRLVSLRLWGVVLGNTGVSMLTAFSLEQWSEQQPLLHPDLRGYQFLFVLAEKNMNSPWNGPWVLPWWLAGCSSCQVAGAQFRLEWGL